MQIGQTVKMKVYGGEANLVIVQENDTHVNVCREEELERAKKENRQPIMVGFKKSDIIR
jgi:hypothetical protein